ncbi:MAG: hypothetical protein ACI8X5_002187 [Planctomycetota bacterium]|jgi:hypothetical protein
MSDSNESVCFTCGQPAGEDFPRLNCLPGGQVCPTCRDRLLECLPPCLPGEGGSLEDLGLESSESTGTEVSAKGPQLVASKGPSRLLRSSGMEDEPA